MPAAMESDNKPGVVIVTYNSAAVIGQCLRALEPLGYPVVVVDNASTDGTPGIVSQFPVTLAANVENRGFAAAVNQGFKMLQVQSILLLNPDVSVLGDLRILTECLEEGPMAAAAILTDVNGNPTPAFQFRRFPTPLTLLFENLGLNRAFPSNPLNRSYRYIGERWDQARDIDQPAGALLLIRRDAWQRIGGFDESFHPLWFEDVDFCYRLHQAGWKTRFLPIVLGTHVGAHSIERLEPGLRQLYWYRSLLRYSAKHFSVVWVRILALSVLIALAGKSVIMTIQLRHRGQPKQLLPAAKLALKTFFHGRLPSGGTASA